MSHNEADARMLGCQYCKSKTDILPLGDGLYKCDFCGAVLHYDTAKKTYQEISAAFDVYRLDAFTKAYKALLREIKPLHPNYDDVVSRAQAVISLDPDNLFAHLYKTVFSDANITVVGEFLLQAQNGDTTLQTHITIVEWFIKFFKLSYYDKLIPYVKTVISPYDASEAGRLLGEIESACVTSRTVFIIAT
jgi:hypothetical protein